MKEIKIEVTQNCYRMCVHCSSDAKVQNYHNLDLSFIEKLLVEAKNLGVESVVFTGGEAMLYPHLEDAIIIAKKLDYYVKMYSMCDPNMESIEKLRHLNKVGLDEIIYSTSYALTRDSVVTFSALEKFFPKLLQSTNLKLGIHHVITNQTLADLDANLRLFLKLPSDQTKHFSILRYIPHGRGDESLMLNDMEFKNFKQYIREQVQAHPNKIRLGSPWNILGISYTKCNAANENLIVGFDGHVYPCDAMKYFDYLGQVENAHHVTLKEIYDSDYFRRIREVCQTSSSECHKCHSYTLCHGGCLGQKMVYMMRKCTTFEDYHLQALRTMNNFKDVEHIKMNGEMGLVGEIGELIDLFKKYETHSLTDEKKEQLKENAIYELGDITWYLAASLAKFYQYSFSDIASYLKGKVSYHKIDDDALGLCAKEKDPLCNYVKPGLPLSILDYQLPGYDISQDWKRLPMLACSIISAKSKEEVLANASLLLVDLAAIANYTLGLSFTEVINKNVEKLQKRYHTGFNVDVANERISQYSKYKQEEPDKVKKYL